MSIITVGFTAFSDLPANSPVRLTMSQSSFDLLDNFPAACRVIYDSLLPTAGVAPYTQLAVVGGDAATVVDGNTKRGMKGSELLNNLQYLDQRFASVTKVELLTQEQRNEASSEAGAEDRQDATTAAASEAKAGGIAQEIRNVLGTVGTVGKWTLVVVGVVALAYLASKVRE